MEPKSKIQKDKVLKDPDVQKWAKVISTKTNEIQVKYDSMFQLKTIGTLEAQIALIKSIIYLFQPNS